MAPCKRLPVWKLSGFSPAEAAACAQPSVPGEEELVFSAEMNKRGTWEGEGARSLGAGCMDARLWGQLWGLQSDPSSGTLEGVSGQVVQVHVSQQGWCRPCGQSGATGAGLGEASGARAAGSSLGRTDPGPWKAPEHRRDVPPPPGLSQHPCTQHWLWGQAALGQVPASATTCRDCFQGLSLLKNGGITRIQGGRLYKGCWAWDTVGDLSDQH